MYFQGNNIGVYDKTGKLVQRTDYYASGEPWLEPEYGNGAYGNRYLFSGKERMAGGALNEYDFEARNYVASFQRFTTIDPLTEVTPSISPYAYCNANPVNFTDPFGLYVNYDDAKIDAMDNFGNANIYFDWFRLEYYLALDESGTKPYTTGGVLTKHYGPQNHPSRGTENFMIGNFSSFMSGYARTENFEMWMNRLSSTESNNSQNIAKTASKSKTVSKQISNAFGDAANLMVVLSIIETYQKYNHDVENPYIGPNMKKYLKQKHSRDQMFNLAGIGRAGVYGAAASFGYNLGYVIEDAGQWIFNNPDFRIRINPYTLDFTPIEQTLQLYDELGIEIY